jgi:hypothetical protein
MFFNIQKGKMHKQIKAQVAEIHTIAAFFFLGKMWVWNRLLGLTTKPKTWFPYRARLRLRRRRRHCYCSSSCQPFLAVVAVGPTD